MRAFRGVASQQSPIYVYYIRHFLISSAPLTEKFTSCNILFLATTVYCMSMKKRWRCSGNGEMVAE